MDETFPPRGIRLDCDDTPVTLRWFLAFLPFVKLGLTITLLAWFAPLAGAADPSPEVAQLAAEVRGLGWVVFAARSEQDDWDLFLMRPDGSQRRALSRTPEWHEGAPQFSRDGTRLLYRRLKSSGKFDGNRYGEQGELVLANSDGSGARALGAEGELPWASWSPDGRELASLSIKGVAFAEAATGKILRTLPRNGFFQQVTWSPDGQWLCGVSNSFGAGWSIGRMHAATGAATAVSTFNCCTPDWFPDGGRIVFSNRPSGQKTNRGQGWTQLWMAAADGSHRQLLYGEDGRHVYGGHVSPDGKYVLFTGNVREDGDPERSGAPMGLMRLSDAPIIVGDSAELRALHPATRSGPVLILPEGWEPSWTLSEIRAGTPPTTTDTKR